MLTEMTTYHDREKTQIKERYFVDESGKKQGSYEEYDDNGRLYKKGTFKDDKKDGLHETYHKNGQLYIRCVYKDDKYDGLYEAYNKNGRLFLKSNYKDGEEHGLFEQYDENGNVIKSGMYTNGKFESSLKKKVNQLSPAQKQALQDRKQQGR